jgi:hypothetical protein
MADWLKAALGKALPSKAPGESGYFSTPSQELDPHLFDGEVLKENVRTFIIRTLSSSLRSLGLKTPELWLHIWIAGSGITYQWDAARGNGDLDILFGVDLPEFILANGNYNMGEDILSEWINSYLKDRLWPKTDNTDLNGQHYEVTFYLNPGTGNDIRNINPYAAYNVVENSWTVRPPKLPPNPGSLYPHEWFGYAALDTQRAHEISDAFNEQYEVLRAVPVSSPRYHSATASVNNLVAQAHALLDEIHLGRREAFQGQGHGYSDWHNFRWQEAKKSGIIRDLVDITSIAVSEREADEIEKYGQPIAPADVAIREAMRSVNRSDNH